MLAAFAFILSFGYALVSRPSSPSALTSDSLEYHSLAVSILKEKSFQGSLFRAPGYPIFLAGIYSLAGAGKLWPVYLVQAALVAFTIVLVHAIALRVTRSTRVAVTAAAICALWPPIWMSAGDVLTEVLAGFLTAVVLYGLLLLLERGTCVLSLFVGLMCGTAALTKGPFLFYSGVCAVFAGGAGKTTRHGLKLTGCLLASMALVVGPWVLRNYIISGEFVPVQTGGGMNFWLGNSPEFWRTQHQWGRFPRDVEALIEGKPEVERERILARLGWKTIADNPLRAAGLFLRKFSYLWLGALGADPASAGNPIPHIGRFGIPKRSLVYVPLFILSVAGWLSLDREARVRARPMTVLMIVWSLPYIATMAVARYALPVVYYEIVLVSAAISRLMPGRNRIRKNEAF